MKITRFMALAALSVLLFACEKEEVFMNDSIDSSMVKSKKVQNNTSYMVISQSESLSDGLEDAIKNYGTVVRTIPQIGIVVVESSDPNFEKKVAKISNVRSVIPDLMVQWIAPMDFDPMANPVSIGDDEQFFNRQWGMDAIDAPEAWNAGYQGEGVKVFILDSGIDAEHPDLAPNLNTTLSESFVPGEDWNIQPGFYFNHGTHVAGIVAAADNVSTDLNTGVIGVAPKAEIVAVKVLSEYSGSGAFSWINAGIIYAADNGADVINMSLGAVINKNGFVYDDEGNLVGRYSPKSVQEVIHAQQRAINYANYKGATVVVAAGNDYMNADGNGSTVVLPADLNNVITVSATAPYGWAYDTTTNLDEPASYSNIGRSLVDIAAPGGDFDFPNNFWWYDMVYSTISGGWTWTAGTSMASPHVAGVAALIIGKNGGDMAPHEVRKQLLNTADKIDTNGNSLFYGKGRLNAFRAVTE